MLLGSLDSVQSSCGTMDIIANMSCPSTVSHLIKQLLNYSGRPRRLMALRLELRPSWETFVCAAHCPGTHRHCRRLVGWKAGKHSPEQSITAELVHRQTDLHCTPGKCSPFPRAAPQTSDLPPGFCSPLRHGSCEETPLSLQVSYQGRFRPSQMFSSDNWVLCVVAAVV